MRLKHWIVVLLASSIAALTTACSDDIEDACKKTNELCAKEPGYPAKDCAKANDDEGRLNGEEKKARDKEVECVMDANDCLTARRCTLEVEP